MSTGFSFPPPPPPPPKATSSNSNNWTQNDSTAARGSTRGRGYRGNDTRGQNHDGRGWDHRGGFSSSARGAYSTNGLPPGTFVNPAFANRNSTHHSQDGFHGSQSAYAQKRRWDDPEVSSGREIGDRTAWSRGASRQAPHPMRQPPSVPKVAVAPSVPSFGSLLPPPLTRSSVADAVEPQTNSHDGARSNKLGLVPVLDDRVSAGSDDSEADAEDDVDEEAACSALQSGPLVIEHEGSVTRLQSPAEIKKWIQKRRAMYPSKQRLETKNAEVRRRMEERKRIEREAQATLAAGRRVSFKHDSTAAVNVTLVESIEESLSVPDDAIKHVSAPVLQREASQGSDSAPEQMTTKAGPAKVPPQPTPSTIRSLCKIYLSTGSCKFGKRCRYEHPKDTATRAPKPSGRKTLYQRMVEQEQDQEDALAVQAIKYLGDAGLFRRLGESAGQGT